MYKFPKKGDTVMCKAGETTFSGFRVSQQHRTSYDKFYGAFRIGRHKILMTRIEDFSPIRIVLMEKCPSNRIAFYNETLLF